MSATGRNRSDEAGSTLFEMLVTVAILALITGIAFPRLQNAVSRQTMAEARSAVALAVARARSEAIRDDSPTRVTLAEQGNALEISRLVATPLPAGAAVEWQQSGIVLFGDGSSSGGSGVVRAGAASSRFAIDPATARLDFAS